MTIRTLNTTAPINNIQDHWHLPNEAAYQLISQCRDLAKSCGQGFRLEPLALSAHGRVLCVGISDGADGVAVFYVSNGQYAWSMLNYLYVPMPAGCKHWISMPLEVGILYHLFPSSSGSDHVKAEYFGPASDLRNEYVALHTPPTESVRKRKMLGDDGDISPVLHPSNLLPLSALGGLDS